MSYRSGVQPFGPKDLQGSDPVWLLDLNYAGRVWRLSTKPVTVSDDLGRVYSYPGGLREPEDVSTTLGRLETDPGEASAAVACVLDADVADLVARGHDLTTATATLYMGSIERGGPYRVPALKQTLAQRWHIVTGDVRRPTFADPGLDPGYIEFTLEENPWGEKAIPILRPGGVINSEMIKGGASEDVLGKVVPVVIGRPGAGVYGSPIYQIGIGSAVLSVDGFTLTFAGVLSDGPVVAETVSVLYQAGSGYSKVSGASVYTVNGGDGRLYGMVDPTVLSGTPTVQAFAVWDDGGGIRSPFSGQELRDSAEVAAWAFERSGLPVDVPRWLGLKGRGTFFVDTYINDPAITAWDWLEGCRILDFMNVAVRRGPQGYYPVPYDPEIYYDETLTNLVEGRQITATSPVAVETEPSEIINAAPVRYRLQAVTETFTGFLEFATTRDDNAGARRHFTNQIRASQSRYGVRQGDTLAMTAIADEATASAVAARWINLRALPTFSRGYRAPWWLGWLQVGDSVRLTDKGAGWSDVVAIVSGRTWNGTGWDLEVLVDESMIRDARVYGA